MHQKNDIRRGRTSESVRDRNASGCGLPVVSTATDPVQPIGGQEIQPINGRSDVGPQAIGDILKDSPAVRIAAIPTMFEGVEFRSRLEAKWAAIFTELGWHWTYEPFDLPGWIPDFQLEGRILVEVKPFTFDEQWKPMCQQITRALTAARMPQEVLLLGVDMMPPREAFEGCPQLGWLWSPCEMSDGQPDFTLDYAALYQIKGQYDFSACNMAWHERLGRAVAHKFYFHEVDPKEITKVIGNATNRTKWRPSNG